MSASQTTLSAFEAATVPEPEPEHDGLQAVAAAVSTDWSTTQAREDRNDDRVVSRATCTRCGAPWDGRGVCEDCASIGDVVDAPLRTSGGGR